jgi:hypothetical protein
MKVHRGTPNFDGTEGGTRTPAGILNIPSDCLLSGLISFPLRR